MQNVVLKIRLKRLIKNPHRQNVAVFTNINTYIYYTTYLWNMPKAECCFQTRIDRLFLRFGIVGRANIQKWDQPQLQIKAFRQGHRQKGQCHPHARKNSSKRCLVFLDTSWWIELLYYVKKYGLVLKIGMKKYCSTTFASSKSKAKINDFWFLSS